MTEPGTDRDPNEMVSGVPDTGPHRLVMEKWISCAPFEKLLNIQIESAADGKATLSMPFLLPYAQGAGLMHGGALISLADTALAMAIKSVLPEDTPFGTIHIEANYLRPMKQGRVTARAKLNKKEGRVISGDVTLCDTNDVVLVTFSADFQIARSADLGALPNFSR